MSEKNDRDYISNELIHELEWRVDDSKAYLESLKGYLEIICKDLDEYSFSLTEKMIKDKEADFSELSRCFNKLDWIAEKLEENLYTINKHQRNISSYMISKTANFMKDNGK